jgi:hypothetical protein
MIPNFNKMLASMVTSSKTLRCTDLVHSKVTGYILNSMQSLIPREFATGNAIEPAEFIVTPQENSIEKNKEENPK